jgi:hypothetical protein
MPSISFSVGISKVTVSGGEWISRVGGAEVASVSTKWLSRKPLSHKGQGAFRIASNSE